MIISLMQISAENVGSQPNISRIFNFSIIWLMRMSAENSFNSSGFYKTNSDLGLRVGSPEPLASIAAAAGPNTMIACTRSVA